MRFPISTSYEDNQPRLILTAVDVAEGVPVTFDSYPKEDGHRKTEYGEYTNHDGKDIGFKHVIRYDDGITSDQVMASGSLPINFDYTEWKLGAIIPITTVGKMMVVTKLVVVMTLLPWATLILFTQRKSDTFGMEDL